MADEKVEVKLGAQVDPLKSDMNDAATSIAASLAKIADGLQNFSTQNKKVTETALKNNADLSRSFLELKGSVTGGFNAIAGVVERVRGVVGGLAAILAGGAIWSVAVDHLKEFSGEVRRLENVLGMTSDTATQYALALRIAGSSAEAFTELSLRMARQLKNNEEEFGRNAVATRDAAGAFLPLDTIMQNAFTRMGQLRVGADQAEFALQFFGRSVSEVYQLMVALPAAQERAKQLMADMNVEFGPEKQAQVGEYKREVAVFKEMIGIVSDEIGIKVLPSLENLAKYFNSVGPAAIEQFMKVVTGLLVTIDYVITGFKEWSVQLQSWWNQIITLSSTGMSALNALFHDGWNKAKAIWAEGEASIVRMRMETNAAILGMEADQQKRLAVLGGSGSGKAGPGPMPHGTDTFKSAPKGAGGEADLSGWENVLKASESAFNNMKLQQGSFEVWSVEMTRDYWAKVLEIGNLSAKERINIENKFFDAERKVQQDAFNAEIAGLEAQKAAYKYNSEARIAIAQEEYRKIAERYGAQSAVAIAAYARITEEMQRAADVRARIADIERRQSETTAQYVFTQQKNALTQQLALRQINVQQSLELERQYLDQKLAIDLAAINAEIAASPDNPEKLAQLNAQKLGLVQQYELAKTQIINQAELDRKQFAIQAAADIESAAGNLFGSLATASGKWMDVLNNGLKSLNQQLTQLAGQALAKQLLGAGTTGGDFISKITNGIFGGGAAGAAGKTAEQTAEAAHTTAITADTTALSTLTASNTTLASTSTSLVAIFTTLATSAETASAALASMGTGGGGGAGGGGLLQNILGGFGDIPMFAAGTPYVPQDTLAVVHRGEAIVPRAYNRGNQGSSYSTNNHFFVAGPVDTRSRNQIAASAFEGTRRGVFKTK